MLYITLCALIAVESILGKWKKFVFTYEQAYLLLLENFYFILACLWCRYYFRIQQGLSTIVFLNDFFISQGYFFGIVFVLFF